MEHILVTRPTSLTFMGKTYRCAVGENGFTAAHKEGDKATPIGEWPLRELRYRADRVPTPQTALKMRGIRKSDGWCDDPKHPMYNHPVRLPFEASHENLWREDHLYDIIVPLGFNDDPVVPGAGSAIFLHLATPEYTPTAGCIAVNLADMKELLAHVSGQSKLIVKPA